MTHEEKIQLYQDAKDAYYSGEPLMSDLEFDKLEKEIGLENKGYIGTHHSEEYTVKHPFLMGSLSKVQVKEDKDKDFGDTHSSNKEFKHIDFQKYADEAETYLSKSHAYSLPGWEFQATPKYDGCSVEIVIDDNGNFVSASTRGDGEYGKPIDVWMKDVWERDFKDKSYNLFMGNDSASGIKFLVVRGECLVKRSVFENKYKRVFTNPRSFVAGVLGQDWNDTPEQRSIRKDLCVICYDYRFVSYDGSVNEIDYLDDKLWFDVPGEKASVFKSRTIFNKNVFSMLYEYFDNVRKNEIDYALDGFVIKPAPKFRLQELDRERQRDCIAIKFLPEIVTTTIEDVEWNVGKTGEYFPTAICKEVILGDKKVTKASLHNYSNMKNNNIGIGAEIRISLAGDIIPFVYEVVKTPDILDMKLPEDSYVCQTTNDGSQNATLHLMKDASETDHMKISLMSSVSALKINGIGEKVAERLFNEVSQEPNIINYMSDTSLKKIKDAFGESKSTENLVNSLISRKNSLNIYEIILSMSFTNCGEKMSKIAANIILGNIVDTTGANKDVLAWANDPESKQRQAVERYMEMFGISKETKKYTEFSSSSQKTKVILTGDPKFCTPFATKKLWLESHPEYEETSSWKEAQVLFTNDLSSTTSKMEKAKKLGIEIRIYEK